VPLGLYLHIPFCRKRCHFCYFRVYTNKNAQQVEQYLDLLAREWDRLRAEPRDRRPAD
jgi:oxygen-independent coproporphyrinogen-3 oxidase